MTECCCDDIIIEVNEEGIDGVGISSIELVSTVGITKNYRINLTNGTYFDYSISDGSSIASISKTSSVGLVDTYTVLLTNGDTSTFEVTNGNGIASITKTSTDNLTDVYTIQYTNGTTSTFSVTNGNSIASVSKVSTQVLTDTYQITYTDEDKSPDTFTVVNGRGIVSITKTSTSGLTDTYTITYNDSSTSTFTVTNGEKGDKGDTGDTGNGIASITLLSESGLVKTYRITMTDGTHFDFDVTDGAKGDTGETGATGNGIQSIEKTATVGLVDTYTITMTDGTTTTFTVTNGSDMWGNIEGTLSDQTDLQNALDSKAPAITETASGSIVSFTDGSTLPVENLTVSIEPVQDLHGYDNPWPGGGSVNLISDVQNTDNGFLDRKYIKDDGSTVASDGYCVCEYVPCKPSTIYTCKKYTNAQSIVVAICFYDSEKNFLSGEAYNNRISYQVTSPENAAFFRTNFDRLETAGSPKYFMVVEGTETPETWLPYSNVCPISGWESTRIFRAGKNLLNPANFDSATVSVSDGIYTFDKSGYNANINTGQSGASGYTIPTTYFPKLPFLQPGTYVWSYKQTSGSNLNRIWSIDNTGEKTNVTTTDLSTEDRKIYRFTITEPTMIIIVRASNTNPTVFSEPQLELGSEFTGYEPFVGDVLSVDFPVSETVPDGTYYSGMLDVTTGTMTVDRGIVYLKDLEWTLNASTAHAFDSSISNRMPYANATSVSSKNISNIYAKHSPKSADADGLAHFSSGFAFGIHANLKNKVIYVKDDRVSTVEEAVALFTTESSYIVYELASPVTIPLTPAQMQTLLGENHIWADTGDVAVEYRADTKRYIQKLTQPTEDDMIANANIASGKYFMVGNSLYLSTASIAQGDAIVPGTNCTPTSLAEALNAINA